MLTYEQTLTTNIQQTIFYGRKISDFPVAQIIHNNVVHNAKNRAKHQHLNKKSQRANSTFIFFCQHISQRKKKNKRAVSLPTLELTLIFN